MRIEDPTFSPFDHGELVASDDVPPQWYTRHLFRMPKGKWFLAFRVCYWHQIEPLTLDQAKHFYNELSLHHMKWEEKE
jgi:cytochrome c peroxidase